MQTNRFDHLTKSLSIGTRRGLLRLLPLVPSLIAISVTDSAAKKKHKKRKKRKKRKNHETQSPPPPPMLEIAYQCPGPSESNNFTDGDGRRAQVFTAGQSGTLRQIHVAVNKVGTPGDFVVQLLKVTANVPGNTAGDVMASMLFPDATVPSGETTLIANFAGPHLVQGTEYAVAATRPGSDHLEVELRLGNDCAGLVFNAGSTGVFAPGPADRDLIVTVLVD